ncbi:MAG: hypothetical protein PF636_05605 [Actinomycetota bacterium]|nr:hypothetical protein [Actinomycetota bacterium]
MLLGAAVGNLLALGLSRIRRSDWSTAYGRLVAGTGLMVLTVGAAVTRHSWRASYNQSAPVKLMGRYVIYFTVFFLILGFAVLMRERFERRGKMRFILISWVVPAVVLVLSYVVVVGEVLHPVGKYFVTDRGGVNALCGARHSGRLGHAQVSRGTHATPGVCVSRYPDCSA